MRIDIRVWLLLIICAVSWWSVITFGIKLVPEYERQGYAYTLNQEECAEIYNDTKGMDVNGIVRYAKKYTADRLDFAIAPTYELKPGQGNCITYTAMCAAVANHAFIANGIDAHAYPSVGTIKFLGFDLCKIASRYGGGFFADHDFVKIQSPDKSYCIDPSIYDILRYDFKTKI